MINRLFKKNYEIKGLPIKPDLIAADLDIVKIDNVNTLVYPLEDSKFEQYIPTVNIGDKVSKGQCIAKAEKSHGYVILSAADGVVESIEMVNAPLAQKQVNALIIKPDNTQYVFEDVLFNIDLNIDDYPSEMIFQKTVQANIQGLGGGLFLAAKKMQATKIKQVLINAVECEPILNCDEALLTHYLAESLFGALLVQKAVKAEKISIVLKENKTDLISHLEYFIENNKMFNNINVLVMPDVYPSGSEKEMLKHLFNIKLKAGEVAVQQGFLMQNIMTCTSIFRAVTVDLKQLERVFSVFGKNIENPKNVLAPIGTTAEDILDFLKIKQDDISSMRIGGLMMGEDIIINKDNKHTALLKSSNGIILNTAEEKVVTDCINCGLCVKACPVDLAPHKMFKAAENDDFNNVYLDRLFECMNCNLCNYVCPSNIDLVGMFKYAKQQVYEINNEKSRADYINTLTQKKLARTEAENLEKERIKLERKLAREQRLANKKQEDENDSKNV